MPLALMHNTVPIDDEFFTIEKLFWFLLLVGSAMVVVR